MGALPENQANPLSRDRWLEIFSRHISPDVEPAIRRKSRRYGLEFGVARLQYLEDGTPLNRTVPLLQISAEGLMVKSRKPIQAYTPLRMEVTLDDDTFALNGRVLHCTQTVGSYKVGIELRFPDED